LPATTTTPTRSTPMSRGRRALLRGCLPRDPMSFLESLEQDYTLSLKEGWFARVEGPARPRPATLTKAAIAQLSGTQRLRYEEQRSVWHANLGPILTPQMDTVVAELDEIIESNRQDGDKGQELGPARRPSRSGQDHSGCDVGGGVPPPTGERVWAIHRRRPPTGPGGLHRADSQHLDAQPQLDALPVLWPSRGRAGQRHPARQPRRRLRVVVQDPPHRRRRRPLPGHEPPGRARGGQPFQVAVQPVPRDLPLRRGRLAPASSSQRGPDRRRPPVRPDRPALDAAHLEPLRGRDRSGTPRLAPAAADHRAGPGPGRRPT
jgi:hypothetical protein